MRSHSIPRSHTHSIPMPPIPSLARFAHLYRVEICLKCHHAPFPFPEKNKTQPPATEPLIGALRSVSSVITSPPPSSPQNAMLFGVLRFPETVALRKDQRKIDRFPQQTTPRFKNNSGRRPRSAAAPVALALLHRGYHQETKESGKKSREMQESRVQDEAKGWRSARRPSTQRRRPARRRRVRRPRGAPKPC